MPKIFGVPYMGSKTKIALDILKQLPKGNRFVDLFGGGFAMSHAALLTNRYNYILYNDINPLITDLVKRAINGEFNYNTFKPHWVSREDFFKYKEQDGYIKYCWSFGSDGKTYIFGKDIEPIKHALHDLIVFGSHSPIIDKSCPTIYKFITATNIHQRRIQAQRFFSKKFNEFPVLAKFDRLQQLETLKRTQQFENLKRYEQLERSERVSSLKNIPNSSKLHFSNFSYLDYIYQDGDIVYCDPPYENTNDYGSKFDHKQFYDWCYSRPYQVFFSSYKISDNRFNLIFAKQLNSTLSSSSNYTLNFECLYSNK